MSHSKVIIRSSITSKWGIQTSNNLLLRLTNFNWNLNRRLVDCNQEWWCYFLLSLFCRHHYSQLFLLLLFCCFLLANVTCPTAFIRWNARLCGCSYKRIPKCCHVPVKLSKPLSLTCHFFIELKMHVGVLFTLCYTSECYHLCLLFISFGLCLWMPIVPKSHPPVGRSSMWALRGDLQ